MSSAALPAVGPTGDHDPASDDYNIPDEDLPPKEVWTLETKPDPTSTKKLNYFWKLTDVDLPDPVLPKQGIEYALLYFRFIGRKDYSITFVPWDNFARYRQADTSSPPQNWTEGKLYNLNNRFVLGLDANGSPSSSEVLPDADLPLMINWFGDTFAKSQEQAQTLDMQNFPYWEKKGGKTWSEAIRGKYTSKQDTREFNQHKDGVYFVPKHQAPIGSPSPTAEYVKMLATGEGDIITTFNERGGSGISRNGIFIEVSLMDQLRKSEYKWAENGDNIPIREANGRINYVTLRDANLQSAKWWEKAWTNAVTKLDWKPVRSRNVKGLTLLFIIVDDTTGLTVERLTEFVNPSVSSSADKPAQDAQVVSSKDTAKVDELKKTYNIFLSVSPFGDYETWIQEKDLVSYMQSYPGYPLPADNAALKSAFDALDPSEEATKRNATYNKALEANAKILAGQTKTDLSAEFKINQVSIQTIRVAGVKNARASVSGQQTQMGGSASAVAKALGWANPGARIEGSAQGGLTWDAPGTYPAEWLHRSAFSWGNEKGIEMSQANTNLIFGSSEANSLMTRFEKSWQRLFVNDDSVQEALGTKPKKYLTGLLITKNTPPESEIIESSVESSKVKRTMWQEVTQQGGKPTIMKDGAPDKNAPDYWSWTTELKNLSFSLGYELHLVKESEVRGGPMFRTSFYPFQRGFFTRLEADVDQRMLDWWAEELKNPPTISTPPVAYVTTGLSADLSGLTLNRTATSIDAKSSTPMFETTPPKRPNPGLPSTAPTSAVWRTAVGNESLEVGGAQMSNLSVVTTSGSDAPTKLPLDAGALSDAASTGQMLAQVAPAPLTGASLPSHGDQADAVSVQVDAPPELQDTSAIPDGFVLSGTIKLFGIANEHIYSYHGTSSFGVRQVIPLAPGTRKVSDYIPMLAGSELEAVQLQNTEFSYNQLTTPTFQAGTWLKTDVLFTGPLQPVSDALRDVFHQDKPMLRLEAKLSAVNDWSKPIRPSSFGLRGSLPNVSIKFCGFIEFTDIGITINIGRHREPWPPYAEKIDWALGFFGSLNLETPNEQAPLVLNYYISEYSGVMSLLMNAEDTISDFFGISGLHLSGLSFIAAFATGSTPSSLNLQANATIELRDTFLDLSGHYTSSDWGLFCDLKDFDFASLSDMYEDLFGSPLHLAEHEVVVEDLAFFAGSGGITITGAVTIAGHACANATVSLTTLGFEITGAVNDIPLAKDLVLKNASLDVFIGRKSDTTLAGPGTSFRFAINGTVSVASNDISATLFIGTDAHGNLAWTVYGAFQGAFSLSKIAPELKGTFLDLSLQQACLIASNVDSSSVAATSIPVGFPIVKGVQIAASLGSIAILDHTMNNKGTPTTGLTLQAMYAEETSSFSLNINLAAPQAVSMKGSTVTSGPVSLEVVISTTPILILKADFFVRVPNQAEPLKFSGGIKASIDEATLFIELANQWWINPFGLSPQLKLGPDLALQIGIVYAGPVYPSEIGVAAGLAIGSVQGQAALSISEAPNDELIMIEIENLGVNDLVDFASLIFQESIPKPGDFLRFKEAELYISTGTTIGTIVYPPGASFSCDAVIFGKECQIYCGVDKSKKSVAVKGSLDPIDVGPLSISGIKQGTKAELDVSVGAQAQSVLINGAIRICDLDSVVYVAGSFMPSFSLDLKTELDFSTHLTFLLQATMKHGSFKTLSDLRALEFDVDFLFHQDILDYIVAQFNLQIATAKHAVDDGITTAKNSLDKAQAQFDKDVQSAQAKLDDAKKAYDAKVADVTGKLAAEKKNAELQTQRLKAAADAAFKSFQDAVAAAQRNLQTAKTNSANAIRADQQKLNDAKNKSDAAVNAALKKVADAKNDMQKRFGNAIHELDDAKAKVASAQGAVNSAQRDYDNASHDYDHCEWYDKLGNLSKKGAAWTVLEGTKAGLATATGILQAAQNVVSGPGYSAANAAITASQHELDADRAAATASINAANSTLQATINAQNALVASAQSALSHVQTAGAELQANNVAKKALQDFEAAENKVLDGLNAAVAALAKCAEKVAFDAATTALNVAKAQTKDIDVAKGALDFADKSADSVLDVSGWIVKNAVNVLNIKQVEVTGDLRGLCDKSSQLQAHIVGTFAEHDVDFSIEFFPGRGEQFVADVFNKLMADVKNGVLKIAK